MNLSVIPFGGRDQEKIPGVSGCCEEGSIWACFGGLVVDVFTWLDIVVIVVILLLFLLALVVIVIQLHSTS